MKISYLKFLGLVQEAINAKYPAIRPSDWDEADELPPWARRYYIENLWDDKVLVCRNSYYAEEKDPALGLVSVTLEESEESSTVSLGEMVPMKRVAKSLDGKIEVEFGRESKESKERENFGAIRKALKHIATAKGMPESVRQAAIGDLENLLTTESILVERNAAESQAGELFSEALTSVIEGEFDKENMVIKGHKVLSVESRNGRRYPIETQKNAVGIFEGAKAYLNHPKMTEMGEARDVRDLIGEHRNIRVEGNSTFSDLHLINSPTVRDYVLPVVESNPRLIGASVVVRAVMKKAKDGIPEATQIVACRSIDLVSEPATTNGIYESVTIKENDMEMKDLTLEELKKQRPDLVKAIEEPITTAKNQEMQVISDALKVTNEKVANLEANHVKLERDAEIRNLVAEANVPDEIKYDVTDGKKTIKENIRGILERCQTQEERNATVKQWEGMFASTNKKKEKETVESTKQDPVPDSVPTGITPTIIERFYQSL